MSALRDELVNDPLTRGYAGMTPEQAAASLNTANRTRLKDTVTTGEIFEALVKAEYDALSAANKTAVNLLLGLGVVRVNGANTQATLLGAFGAGTTTRANLVALAKDTISRATELGIARVKPGHVAAARAE